MVKPENMVEGLKKMFGPENMYSLFLAGHAANV